jgi:hypothetical protein
VAGEARDRREIAAVAGCAVMSRMAPAVLLLWALCAKRHGRQTLFVDQIESREGVPAEPDMHWPAHFLARYDNGVFVDYLCVGLEVLCPVRDFKPMVLPAWDAVKSDLPSGVTAMRQADFSCAWNVTGSVLIALGHIHRSRFERPAKTLRCVPRLHF